MQATLRNAILTGAALALAVALHPGPATARSGSFNASGAATPPISAQPQSSTTGMGSGSSLGTGVNTGGINEPGVPNTTTPGIIGTGAAPSGLPGDNPAHPGFPGRVGQ